MNFGDDKNKYHKIILTAYESTDEHKKELWTKNILIIIAGCIFFPLFIIFLFMKYDVDMQQKLVVDFVSTEGKKATFCAETLGRIKIGVFSNSVMEGQKLGGLVSTSNINSVINQMIVHYSILE